MADAPTAAAAPQPDQALHTPMVPIVPTAKQLLGQNMEAEQLPRQRSQEMWKVISASAEFYKFATDYEASLYDLREAREQKPKDPTVRKWRKLAVKSCKDLHTQWDSLTDALAVDLRYCQSHYTSRECQVLVRNSILLRDTMKVLNSLCEEAATARKHSPAKLNA